MKTSDIRLAIKPMPHGNSHCVPEPSSKISEIEQCLSNAGVGNLWPAFDPREHLTWSVLEFSLPKLEENITSKQNSMTNT